MSTPQPAPDATGLVRVVSRWQIVGLSINDVIGSGIYLLPAATAALLGPMSLWAVMLAGLAVALLVLCYAQAASYFDTPGGSYLYTREALGPFVGFQIGWMIWLTRISSAAALSNGLADAVARFWPTATTDTWARLLVVVGSLGLLTAINVIGVKSAARTGIALVIGKLLPLLLFVAIGLFYVDWSWAFAGTTPDLRDLGNLGEAALLLLFAYAGFENIPAAAGEYRNPRRDVPFALITMIVTVTLDLRRGAGGGPGDATESCRLAHAAGRCRKPIRWRSVGTDFDRGRHHFHPRHHQQHGDAGPTLLVCACTRWVWPSVSGTRASALPHACRSSAYSGRTVACIGVVGIVYAVGITVDGHAPVCLHRHRSGGDRAGAQIPATHRYLAPAWRPSHPHRRLGAVAGFAGQRQLAESGRRRRGAGGRLGVLSISAQAG